MCPLKSIKMAVYGISCIDLTTETENLWCTFLKLEMITNFLKNITNIQKCFKFMENKK